MVEQGTENPRVRGSIPFPATMKKRPRTCGNAVRGFFLGNGDEASCHRVATGSDVLSSYRRVSFRGYLA